MFLNMPKNLFGFDPDTVKTKIKLMQNSFELVRLGLPTKGLFVIQFDILFNQNI